MLHSDVMQPLVRVDCAFCMYSSPLYTINKCYVAVTKIGYFKLSDEVLLKLHVYTNVMG